MPSMKQLIEAVSRRPDPNTEEGRWYWGLTPAERIEVDNKRIAGDSASDAEVWKHMKSHKPEKKFIGNPHKSSNESIDNDDDNICLACNGSGKEYGETCVTCGGKGYIQDDIDENLAESIKAQFEDYVKNSSSPEDKKVEVKLTYNDGHTQTKWVTDKEKKAYEVSSSISKVELVKGEKYRIDDSAVEEGIDGRGTDQRDLEQASRQARAAHWKRLQDEESAKKKSTMTKVSVKRPIDVEIADIGAGGKKHNVKTIKGEVDEQSSGLSTDTLNNYREKALKGAIPALMSGDLRKAAKRTNGAGKAGKMAAIRAKLAQMQESLRETKEKMAHTATAVGESKKSENRELWDKINSKGVVPSIDRERYTDLSHEGLEGPFRMKSGRVVYYDPKAGSYYDRDTDMYLDNEETDMLQRESAGDGNPKQAKLAKMKALLDDLQCAVKETKGKVAVIPSRVTMIRDLEAMPKGGEDFEWNRHQAIEHFKKGNMVRGKYYMALASRKGSLKEAPIDQTVPGVDAQGKPLPPGAPAPGEPMTPAQQAPTPAGTPTVPPKPGQPAAPTAGQPGGAPAAAPPGTPPPAAGGQVNAATTSLEQIKALVNTAAQNPGQARALAVKLNAIK